MNVNVKAAAASEFKIPAPSILISIDWTTSTYSDAIARQSYFPAISVKALILSPSFSIGKMVVMCITFVNGLYSGLDGA
jgi:hypothetical protein